MTFHRQLVESTATVSQIEDEQKRRRLEDDRFEAHLKSEELQRHRQVNSWLRAADVTSEQYHFSKVRASHQGTGQWLLDHPLFKSWLDPQFPNIPPLLWLTGIPGAGKIHFDLTIH